MAEGDIHTKPHGDGWANEREGASRVSETFKTKQEAQEAGRAQARREKVEHFIHNKDGTIGERNTYGPSDPASPG